jgi:hypothetical protein
MKYNSYLNTLFANEHSEYTELVFLSSRTVQCVLEGIRQGHANNKQTVIKKL